ncbi:ribokinase [Flammeovirga agarivorans]|uniref:Ribokinase n=1 Tax=Flammeovirga agarivorans TaxID=2726742 RepID=A0A7X8XXZ2_9BACT|nr:ribokinase [Flammeovirga agarivorans]NLR93707.1 ribokinase [Flammeovirga agarivorans]
MKKKIIVIGSSNTDLVARSNRLPRAGETIIGSQFFQNQGGKGANQAVACAKLGGETTFIACVGKDDFGKVAKESYKKVGINTDYISSSDQPTGVAMINVDDHGENCIVVVPGANNDLDINRIDKVSHLFSKDTIVLLQLEVPIKTIEHSIEVAHQKGAMVIVNPAPAQALSDEVLSKVNYITPNETELTLLTGVEINNEEGLKEAVEKLHQKGIENVIVTLGSKGCYVSSKELKGYYEAQKVKAVDTTAAGDVFNGAFTAHLAENYPLSACIEFGTRAATFSVTKAGAQASIPSLEELNN